MAYKLPTAEEKSNYVEEKFDEIAKKYALSTKTVINAGNAGTATALVDLDPLAISIGFGWRF